MRLIEFYIFLILMAPATASAWGGSNYVRGPIAGFIMAAILIMAAVVTISEIFKGLTTKPLKTIRLVLGFIAMPVVGFGVPVFFIAHTDIDDGAIGMMFVWILGWVAAWYAFKLISGEKE